jgi:DNA invertase Pin-like site-specific DNA recombinase
MAQRDAILQIQIMAEKKEFDVLIVYKSDRIGRTSDESPMIVKQLNDKGIRIITANGEEIKTNTQMDKLMTYLTFWQNESESVKLSERVADYHKMLIQEGRYRGGTVPYGYMIIDNGAKNYKGRLIYDFIVNPQEVEIVKLIYNLAVKSNMGSRSIAKYLNEHGYIKSNGNGWAFNTVTNVLNNPIYKGHFLVQSKVKKEQILSPKIQELVIIDEDLWEQCQRSRKNRKVNVDNGVIKGATRGNALLAGIAYCGYCNNKMHIWNNHKYYTNKNGIKKKVVVINYRCQSSVSSGRIQCKGQKTYSSKKIDSFIEDEIAEYIVQLQESNVYDQLQNDIEFQYNKIVKDKKIIEQSLREKDKQMLALKKEIANSIMGNGIFSMEELKESISLIQEDINQLNKNKEDVDLKLESLQIKLGEVKSVNVDLVGWINKFKSSDLIIKKSMISDVIETVVILGDNINVVWKVKWEEFQEKLGS